METVTETLHYMKMWISPEVTEYPGRVVDDPYGTFAYKRMVFAYRSDNEFCFVGIRGSVDPVEEESRKVTRMSRAAFMMRKLLDSVKYHAVIKLSIDEFGDVVAKLNPEFIPEWISRDSREWVEILPEDEYFGSLVKHA